jgi:hypothetical protein
MGIQILFKNILEAEGKFCNLKKQIKTGLQDMRPASMG